MVFYSLLVLASLNVVVADFLNTAGVQSCLDSHNAYRSDLAQQKVKNGAGQTMPGATDMNELKYGKDLEAKAQDWAKQCPGMSHTPNANYGQNLFWSSAKLDHATAMKQATALWWKEVSLLKSNTTVVLTMEMFNQGVGHFTQMAQSKNTLVGCAVQSCSGTYVVCNYDGQNWLNQPIYKTGTKTCSACDSTRKVCRNGLCAN
ncbi:hypothetical protein M3Y94_00032300 [Aphelenchoides besseyi]|nr:hypothetical protein M3Y94_00032300 [Aphelenchoides besseyi]KAI6218608.1 Venom allergen-like protein 1 [Aphelenchoides besseyi]